MNNTPEKAIEAKAKRLALDYVNGNRPSAIPLKRVSPQWWAMYGKEWMDVARKHFDGTVNPPTLPESFKS